MLKVNTIEVNPMNLVSKDNTTDVFLLITLCGAYRDTRLLHAANRMQTVFFFLEDWFKNLVRVMSDLIFIFLKIHVLQSTLRMHIL